MAAIPGFFFGKYPSGKSIGKYGLKISRPGYNAVTHDDQSIEYFSFNSEWTDIGRVHARGIASLPLNPQRLPYGTTTKTIPFTNLGYIPFVEVRRKSGLTYYDDRELKRAVGGYDLRETAVMASPYRDHIQASLFAETAQVFYCVYRIRAV
jgi:hypothetical protein